MGVAKRKLNPQELELVETYRKAGVEPVGVDLASRKIQVCYLRKNGSVFNGQLKHEDFFKFIENSDFFKKQCSRIDLLMNLVLH